MKAGQEMPWRFLRQAGAQAVRRRVRLVVEGEQHVPDAGPVIIAARHFHHLFDGAILMAMSRRPTHILVSSDWTGDGIQGRVMEVLNGAARWPTVDRRNLPGAPTRNRRGLQAAAELLREGRVLVVFPEGYPTIDPHGTHKVGDEILPFHRGLLAICRLASSSAPATIPVVPCGFRYRQLTDGRWEVVIRFGPPTTVQSTRDMQLLEEQVRALSA